MQERAAPQAIIHDVCKVCSPSTCRAKAGQACGVSMRPFTCVATFGGTCPFAFVLITPPTTELQVCGRVHSS